VRPRTTLIGPPASAPRPKSRDLVRQLLRALERHHGGQPITIATGIFWPAAWLFFQCS